MQHALSVVLGSKDETEDDIDDEIIEELSSDNNQQSISLANIPGANSEMWINDKDNLDFRLMTIYVANDGFCLKFLVIFRVNYIQKVNNK